MYCVIKAINYKQTWNAVKVGLRNKDWIGCIEDGGVMFIRKRIQCNSNP